MENVIDIILKRRSVRKFLEKQISANDLDRIVEAGRYAPSGGNNQFTTFLVIQNEKILTELAELVEQQFCRMEVEDGMYQSLKNSILLSKKGGYVFHYHAPTLVILANRRGYDNAMADCAAAMENMMLAATSLGIGSCWINQLKWLSDNSEVQNYLKSLGIGEGEQVMGSVALGYGEWKNLNAPKRTGNPVVYIR